MSEGLQPEVEGDADHMSIIDHGIEEYETRIEEILIIERSDNVAAPPETAGETLELYFETVDKIDVHNTDARELATIKYEVMHAISLLAMGKKDDCLDELWEAHERARMDQREDQDDYYQMAKKIYFMMDKIEGIQR